MTKTWNGGTGDWYNPAQWTSDQAGVAYPQPGDSAVVASGTAELIGSEAQDAGTFDTQSVLLGSFNAFAQATLLAQDATFGQDFDIDSDAATPFAAIDAVGTVGFGGTIDADAPGGEFVIQATQADGTQAADFQLLSQGSIEVHGGDAMLLIGNMTLNADLIVGSAAAGGGGTFFNDGTVSLADAAFAIEPGGTLAGTGEVVIGLYSSLYIDANAGATSESVEFTAAGGRLRLGDPANYTGQVSNFLQGDLIDLTTYAPAAITASYASGILTIENDGAGIGQLHVQGPSAGAMQVWSDGAGGTYIGDPGTPLDRLKFTISVADLAMGANVVRATMQTAGGAAITGAGIKIGIISDSFDAYAPGVGSTDPANQDAMDGYLPLDTATDSSAVKVLSDGAPGSSDEGRAMAELVHQVAPGAAIDFASDGTSLADMADSVLALQQDYCNIIVDDVSFYNEPFFQDAGPLDAAIQTVIGDGVSYFTSAGNSGDAAYQASFTPQSVALSGIGNVQAQLFANGTFFQTITIGTDSDDVILQWNAPYPATAASVPDSLVMALYTMSGQLVATSSQDSGDPSDVLQVANAGQYQIAIYNPGGTPTPSLFKYIITRYGSIDDPAAENGAATVFGHEMLPGVNTVAAINAADTPAFGEQPLWTETYSSFGPGEFLYGSSGNTLATPVSAGKVNIVAPDAAATTVQTVAGPTGPFSGTSAAAPNAAAVAALMLQANPNVSPAKVTQLLESSATSMGLPADQQGAGLINAVAAVTAAEAACFAGGTRVLAGRGEVAVEHLRVGETVLAHTGDGRMAWHPVVWIGHRQIDCRRHRRAEDVLPVRIRAGAFGEGLPARDLRLSPDHAVFCDGASGGLLIPVRYLVNGATIMQEPADAVTYWHVELARHGVMLAEGLPCESYLDTGNRAAFANGGAAVAMHPDFARRVWRRQGCADLVVKGRALARVRRRLLARAVVMGHATTGDAALHLLVDGQVRLPAIVGRVYRFPLPGIESRIRLVSRSTVPAYVRAGAVDHRPLGVAVSQIRLDGRTIPLGDARLCSGWHAVEGGKAGAAWRWTDGNAGLALSGVHVLEVEVLMTEQYWVKRNDEARIAVAGHPRRAAVSLRSCVVAG